VYFESGGGGIVDEETTTTKRERKERKNERKKNIAKAGRNIHKNKTKTSKDEGSTTSY
jgi:hypothetical protein